MKVSEVELLNQEYFTVHCRDCDNNSPNFTFTWELTEEGINYLKDKGIKFPFMHVFALEEDFDLDSLSESCPTLFFAANSILPLHKNAGQIQFRKSGKFRIFAMITWGCGIDQGRGTWAQHKAAIMRLERHIYRFLYANIYEYMLPSVVDFHIEIDKSLFAQKENPKFYELASMWPWSKPPANLCEYRNRIWFNTWYQVPLLSLWAITRGIAGLVWICLLLLFGQRFRSIHFSPIFNPFSSILAELYDENDNYCIYDINKKAYTSISKTIFKCPILILSILTVPAALGIWVSSHLALSCYILIGIIIGGIIVYVTSFINNRLFKNKRSLNEYYSIIPVQTKKKSTPIFVRYLDLKSKVCLPFER